MGILIAGDPAPLRFRPPTYRSIPQIPHAAVQQGRLTHGCGDLAPRGVVEVGLRVWGFPVMRWHLAADQAAICKQNEGYR